MTTTTVSCAVDDSEKELGGGRGSMLRPASLLSTPSSFDKDQASFESFPARRPKYTKPMLPEGLIPEEGSVRSLSEEVEVDPPIYPTAALLRPKSSRVSQLVGDGLSPSHGKDVVREPPTPAHLQIPPDSYCGISDSSPIPMSNQYLSKDGWVELKPVKQINNRDSAEALTGSVKAARLRAGARNETRILQPSPAESQASKPYYDAESSHDTGFVPTRLPKAVHESARPSDDMTRLDYSDSSHAPSTTDLNHFNLDLSNKDSDRTITALPQQRKW